MNDNKGSQDTVLVEDELVKVTGGLRDLLVPGAQKGPEHSPSIQLGRIPASVPTPSGFSTACWKSETMQHEFVVNERGDEVCKHCGAARTPLN